MPSTEASSVVTPRDSVTRPFPRYLRLHVRRVVGLAEANWSQIAPRRVLLDQIDGQRRRIPCYVKRGLDRRSLHAPPSPGMTAVASLPLSGGASGAITISKVLFSALLLSYCTLHGFTTVDQTMDSLVARRTGIGTQ